MGASSNRVQKNRSGELTTCPGCPGKRDQPHPPSPSPHLRRGGGRKAGGEVPALSAAGKSDRCPSVELRLAVQGHDRGAAQAQVVLEGGLDVFYLPLVGQAADLPVDLGGLGQARGA